MLNVSYFPEYQSYRQVMVNRLHLGPPPSSLCKQGCSPSTLLRHAFFSTEPLLSSPALGNKRFCTVHLHPLRTRAFPRITTIPSRSEATLAPKTPTFNQQATNSNMESNENNITEVTSPISIAFEQTINASPRPSLPIIATQGCGNTLVHSGEMSEKMEAPALNGFEQIGGAATLQPTGEGEVNPLEVPIDMEHGIEHGQGQGMLVLTRR